MGGKRKIVSLAKEFERGTLSRKEFEKLRNRLFEEDQIRITWNQVKETAIACYETPQDAHEILTKYSQLLRKAHQGTAPIVNFIDAELRKKKQSRRKIIIDNLEELCPWVDWKWSVVKKMKKHERETVVNQISERYRRYKKK